MFSEKIMDAVEAKYVQLTGEYREYLESQGLTLGWVLAETQIERVHSNLISIRAAAEACRKADEEREELEERMIAFIMSV